MGESTHQRATWWLVERHFGYVQSARTNPGVASEQWHAMQPPRHLLLQEGEVAWIDRGSAGHPPDTVLLGLKLPDGHWGDGDGALDEAVWVVSRGTIPQELAALLPEQPTEEA